MKPVVSVVVLTWRPGGFDCFVPWLEKQQADVPFELIVVDELHRWRAPFLASRLAACPFPVKHLPTERSLFPVASTMRAGNTAIKAAEGELIVHVCDHALPPVDFVQKHWDLYTRNPKMIGVAPYRMRKVREQHWFGKGEPLQLWPFLDECARGAQDHLFWSILDRAATPYKADELCEPWDEWTGSPLAGYPAGTPGNEWSVHYKTDSVPLAGYKAVNGWDEEYDGVYAYGDVDMTLRLRAAGYDVESVGCELDVLDSHAPVKRLSEAAYRDYDAARLLQRTREKVDAGQFICDFGLEMTEHAKARSLAYQTAQKQELSKYAMGRFPKAKLKDAVELTLARPWLPGGRITLKVLPDQGFAWSLLTPPGIFVGSDKAFHAGFWGDVPSANVTRGSRLVMPAQRVPTVIVEGSGEDAVACAGWATKWLLYMGPDVKRVERWADFKGYVTIPPTNEQTEAIAVRVG